MDARRRPAGGRDGSAVLAHAGRARVGISSQSAASERSAIPTAATSSSPSRRFTPTSPSCTRGARTGKATSSSPGRPTISPTSTCSWRGRRGRRSCRWRRSSRAEMVAAEPERHEAVRIRDRPPRRGTRRRPAGLAAAAVRRRWNVDYGAPGGPSVRTSSSGKPCMSDDRLVEPAGMDAEQLSLIRDERVRETVARCFGGSEFYRGRLRAAGVEPGDLASVADLERLPVLLGKDDERELQEQSRTDLGHPFGEHLCAPFERGGGGRVDLGHDGQSDLLRLHAARTRRPTSCGAARSRFAGVRPGDTVLHGFGLSCSSPACPSCARSSGWARGPSPSAPRRAPSGSCESPSSYAAGPRLHAVLRAGTWASRPRSCSGGPRTSSGSRSSSAPASPAPVWPEVRPACSRPSGPGLRPARGRSRRDVLLVRRRAVRRDARARRGLRDRDPARRPGDEGARSRWPRAPPASG